MADVDAALETIGAKPQSPFSLMPTPAVDAKSGIKRMGELGRERQRVQEAYDKDAAGLQSKITAERKAAADLKAPKLENVDEKFQHQGIFSGNQLTEAMQTMFAFAAIGGAMTRAPMTAAMNSFAGALKGFQQGDTIAFNQNKETFERNLRAAIAKNQQAMNEYKLAFDKHRGNMQDLMNEWNIIAKKHGDTVSAINMERQDIQGMLRHLEAMRRTDAQMAHQAQMFSAAMKRIEVMGEQKDKDRTSRETIARERIASAKGKGEGLGLKGKMLESYVHNEANIDAIDQVIAALKENPDAVGFKELIPGILLNRADPEGTPIRAGVANIGSMTIKDRAGTAQTANEMKNITPFIPRPGDNAQTQITKLEGMKREMRRMNDTAVRVTGSGGGGGGGAGQPPQIMDDAGYNALPSGATFVDPEGNVRQKP